MTIGNKKGEGSGWSLKRIRNTKVKPILVGKNKDADDRDPRLPFTSKDDWATHVWVQANS